MSDSIKHECGIVLLRLLKPLDFYRRKYGSVFYGFQKLSLLMEKQHNRGQDGAGIACMGLDIPPGKPYYQTAKSNSATPLKDLFDQIHDKMAEFIKNNHNRLDDITHVKSDSAFCGEIYLGHLRYGTFGRNDLNACHPYVKESVCQSRTLLMAGNFNLTNVNQLFQQLIHSGHHLSKYSDGTVMLHILGHYLEEENNMLFRRYAKREITAGEINAKISDELNPARILSGGCANWDGGYVVAGLIGNGDAFVIRDPHGIRPAYYYIDDEIAVVASERPPIQTAFNLQTQQVMELPRGNALIIKKDGKISIEECVPQLSPASCSFEHIYFSRGNDADIYQERKALGRALTGNVLKAINYDLENTVFSFIPNTAETGYLGLREGLQEYCRETQYDDIQKLTPGDSAGLRRILNRTIRTEKIAVKDAKLRTFISDSSCRHDLIGHVYDVTYGVIRPGIDSLVVLDDSIVRGATLRDSILRMLDRLQPKKLIIVSTAPPICYPDCYGIDMASLGDFVAFEAAVRLLRRRERTDLLNQIYQEAKRQLDLPDYKQVNTVKAIYQQFTHSELEAEITDILRPDDLKTDLQIIYQTLDALRLCCPHSAGDWYFSGNYPTPGGNRVVNQAYVNYIEGVNARAY